MDTPDALRRRELLAKAAELVAQAQSSLRDVDLFDAEHPGVALFAELSGLRARLAEKARVGIYTIFDDRALDALVRAAPRNEFELHEVSGFSAERVRQHGGQIIAIILSVIDPGTEAPERPVFTPCSFCNELQLLHAPPPNGRPFHCSKCVQSKDPRMRATATTFKLPTQKDYD